MIDAQNMKYSIMLLPQSVASTATVSATLDTIDYDHVQVYVVGDTASSAMSVIKLGESTDTSTFTDIATFTGGDTTDGFTIASADTSNGVSTLLDVPKLGARERYLNVTITPGATQVLGATAVLSRSKIGPNTAGERGVDVYQTGNGS